MTLAALNFSDQVWHLAALLIALVQPLLVLGLILGFIIASAHLLTMLGTRWGDRRVSSKALLFSLALHVLLACGIVALIPEYRQRILSPLTEFEDQRFRVTPQIQPETPAIARTRLGNVPTWEQIDPASTADWTRFAPPSERAPDTMPEARPFRSPQLEQIFTADRPRNAVEVETKPNVDGTTDATSLATADVQLESRMIQPERREEISTDVPQTDRTPVTPQTPPAEIRPERPETGSVDRLMQEFNSVDRPRSLATPELDMTPDTQRGDDENIVRREGPVPAAPALEQTGTTPRPVPRREEGLAALNTGRSPVPLPSTGSPESMSVERFRPRLPQGTTPTPLDRPRRPLESMSEPGRGPAEKPQIVRRDLNTESGSDTSQIPSTYVLRADEQRMRAVLEYGGSAESEAAVDRSLRWLASMQHPDGYWDASESGAGQIGVDEDGVDRKFAGRESDTGITALAVLAFLGKLNTVNQGEYSDNVHRALRWLASQQRTLSWQDGGSTPGYLGGNASVFAGMYCHGMATFALAEAYAMSRDDIEAQWLREPLQLAVDFIVDTQLQDGGWRYVRGQPDGDMSMFGWQLMALKSAETAGIRVPETTKRRMIEFLIDRRKGRYGGLAGYRAKDQPTAPMTAEALFCRQMLGVGDSPETTREAIGFLLQNPPRRTEMNLYYWYYGTLALFQLGNEEWRAWNQSLRDLLIAEQRTTGPLAGSWDPRGAWGGFGGRIYSTAIATLSLEVYYRYLPLYRFSNR